MSARGLGPEDALCVFKICIRTSPPSRPAGHTYFVPCGRWLLLGLEDLTSASLSHRFGTSGR